MHRHHQVLISKASINLPCPTLTRIPNVSMPPSQNLNSDSRIMLVTQPQNHWPNSQSITWHLDPSRHVHVHSRDIMDHSHHVHVHSFSCCETIKLKDGLLHFINWTLTKSISDWSLLLSHSVYPVIFSVHPCSPKIEASLWSHENEWIQSLL